MLPGRPCSLKLFFSKACIFSAVLQNYALPFTWFMLLQNKALIVRHPGSSSAPAMVLSASRKMPENCP